MHDNPESKGALLEKQLVFWSVVIICAGLGLIALELLGTLWIAINNKSCQLPTLTSYVGLSVMIIGTLSMLSVGVLNVVRTFAPGSPRVASKE